MQSLPQDVLIYLGVLMPTSSLSSFFRLNKRIAALSKDPKFWKKRLLNEFPLRFDILHFTIPFELPDFDRLDRTAIKKYEDYLLGITKDIRKSHPQHIHMNYESEPIPRLHALIEYAWASVHNQYIPPSPTELPKDSRLRYICLTLFQTRKIQTHYAFNQRASNPEYLKLKEQLMKMEAKFNDMERKFASDMSKIENYIHTQYFKPGYYRWTLSTDKFEKYRRNLFGRFCPSIEDIKTLLHEEKVDLELCPGLLIGIFIEGKVNVPKYLLFFYTGAWGNLSVMMTETRDRQKPDIPGVMDSILAKLEWNAEEALKHYQLDFNLHERWCDNGSNNDGDSDSLSYDDN